MNKILQDMKQSQEKNVLQWFDMYQKQIEQVIVWQKQLFDINEKNLNTLKSFLPKESSPAQFAGMIFLTEAQKILQEQQKSIQLEKLKNYQLNVNEFFYQTLQEFEDVMKSLKKVELKKIDVKPEDFKSMFEVHKNIDVQAQMKKVQEAQAKFLEDIKSTTAAKDIEDNLSQLVNFYQKKLQDLKSLVY